MRCVNHPNKQWAVTKCDECGIGLCQGCAGQWLTSLCHGCAPKGFSEQKQRVIKELVYLTVAFLLGGYFLISANDDTKVIENRGLYFLLGSVILAGAIASWRLISQRQRVIFIWVSRDGVPMHVAFRIIICALFGPFLLPYVIYRNTKEYRDARQAEQYITPVNR
jgi:hypothetical protein